MEKDRYDYLEERVKQLEREVELLKQQQAPKSDYIMQTKKENKVVVREKEKTVAKPFSPPPASTDKKKESVDWEQLLGRVWLPRIFIFVLLMGLIWGFKVAVDYGILTEPVRIVIGFVVAIVLFFLGESQLKNKRDSLGKSLLIGAIGMLILTTFAMNVLYGMIPTIVAFSLNVIWVGIGLFLAHRHQSQVMAILIAFIGYLIPFLVVGSGNVVVAVAYETVFYAVLVYYAIYKNFKKLFYTAAVLLHVVYLIFMIGTFMSGAPHILETMAIGAIVQHVILFYSVYRSTFTNMFPIPLLFTSFIATTIWVKLGAGQDEVLYVIYLVVVLLGYAFVVYTKRNMERKDLMSVALSIATFGLFLLFIQLFRDGGNTLAASFLLEGLIALYLGFRFKAIFQKLTGAFIYLAGTLQILSTYINEIVSGETFMWILFILTLYGLIYLIKTFYEKNIAAQITITFVAVFGHLLFISYLPHYEALFSVAFLLALALVLSLFYVYWWTRESYATNKVVQIIVVGINVLMQLIFLTDIAHFLTQSFLHHITMMSTSIAWALYATVSVVVGVFYNKKNIRMLGIGLLILTLLKLIFVDLQYVTIVVRAILFIGLGVTGILLSRLLYVKK